MTDLEQERYRLFEVLGKGTYGKVYKALDRTTDTLVAIKMFNFDENCPESVSQSTFREAGVAAAMKSPNLVKIFDIKFEVERCYMVMELADTDLYSHIRKTRRLPPDEAKDIMWDILMGVRTMHENMYLHRDIKPDNILLK